MVGFGVGGIGMSVPHKNFELRSNGQPRAAVSTCAAGWSPAV
jgi:hypothetical protein